MLRNSNKTYFTYLQEVIKQVMIETFEDNKTKLSSDTVQLVSEIARSLCNEACLRAATRAIQDGSDKIDIDHLEKILPQLVIFKYYF